MLSEGSTSGQISYVDSIINASFRNGSKVQQLHGHGKFGTGALVKNTAGFLNYLPHEDWCEPVKMIKKPRPEWIALIPRGNCEFVTKILNAKALNASAVIIYDNDSTTQSNKMVMKCHGVGSIVAVSISKSFGLNLRSKLDRGDVSVTIRVGKVHYQTQRTQWQAGKTSVLFVLVSFILLMCISLAWLVFYYVQRFRYFYARDKKEVSLSLFIINLVVVL